MNIAIVGAGLAGTVLAHELAVKGPSSLQIAAFDPSEAGPGNAYATALPEHYMNGPVRAMYAVPGDDGHLMRWRASGDANELVPRTAFAAYLRELADATARAHTNLRFHRTEIVQVTRARDAFVLRDEGGSAWEARAVVLALGNPLPGNAFLPPEILTHPRYFGDPWRFDGAGIDDDILLIGTGLTAMDAIVSLARRNANFRVHVVSRHGLLPLVEDASVKAGSSTAFELDTATPYSLLRTMRHAARAHVAKGGDWRYVVDAIRKESPHIWALWSELERRRFLRHVQAYWNIHRYRIPPKTMNVVREMESAHRILHYRGSVRDVRVHEDYFVVAMERAGERSRTRVRYIVNCSGPETDYVRIARPLVRDLVHRGLIRPDSLRLGIDATPSFNVIGAHGQPWPNLFTLGPPLRGLWYETTGVPEVREQAARLAQTLLASAPTGQG
ncbi:MAG: FAD-dependent oxidoreductase [Candidatus Eremiobacteraeota bacterium]|nr:FAD-dependent oxidoreductase [Candidatus Eremiobacteraeota bacterium]